MSPQLDHFKVELVSHPHPSRIHMRDCGHLCTQRTQESRLSIDFLVAYQSSIPCPICEWDTKADPFTTMDNGDASGMMTLAHFASIQDGFGTKPAITADSSISSEASAKPHVCTLCGRRFTHRANLHNHLARHNSPQEYRCSICGKEFSQKGSVRVHERIHSPEIRHTCPICGQSLDLNCSSEMTVKYQGSHRRQKATSSHTC